MCSVLRCRAPNPESQMRHAATTPVSLRPPSTATRSGTSRLISSWPDPVFGSEGTSGQQLESM